MSKQTVAVALSLAALAAAQSLSDLSTECQAGINGLSSNTEANNCLALNQFTNIFLTPSDQSVIAPVTNWLTAFCGASDCSDSTISTVVESITTACAKDLAPLGVTGNDTSATVAQYVQQYFGTAKEVLCLANTSSDQFCATELANDAQDSLGKPLSIDNLVSTLSGVVVSGQSPVNTTIVCTPCTQGIIAVLHDDATIGSSVSSGLSSTCGADFASVTTLPANIVVGTGTAVPKGTGGSDKGDGAATLAVAATFATVAGSLLVAFLA
jgi:hypothetical protein